jgi:hypothetical protein
MFKAGPKKPRRVVKKPLPRPGGVSFKLKEGSTKPG